ncbi:hypothetical protein QE357_005201 [Siphonobacter sp. BAB-5404]|nr:hypothetical protein [Siphonobacter sp. SORGH_AS_0500]
MVAEDHFSGQIVAFVFWTTHFVSLPSTARNQVKISELRIPGSVAALAYNDYLDQETSSFLLINVFESLPYHTKNS